MPKTPVKPQLEAASTPVDRLLAMPAPDSEV